LCLDFFAAFFVVSGAGLKRLKCEYQSRLHPFGRPRSYGPEIAWTILPFSSYAYVTVSSGSTRGSAHSFVPIANWPVIVS
jgi:hypothetical protein